MQSETVVFSAPTAVAVVVRSLGADSREADRRVARLGDARSLHEIAEVLAEDGCDVQLVGVDLEALRSSRWPAVVELARVGGGGPEFVAMLPATEGRAPVFLDASASRMQWEVPSSVVADRLTGEVLFVRSLERPRSDFWWSVPLSGAAAFGAMYVWFRGKTRVTAAARDNVRSS